MWPIFVVVFVVVGYEPWADAKTRNIKAASHAYEDDGIMALNLAAYSALHQLNSRFENIEVENTSLRVSLACQDQNIQQILEMVRHNPPLQVPHKTPHNYSSNNHQYHQCYSSNSNSSSSSSSSISTNTSLCQ